MTQQQKFSDKEKLTFPLYADSDQKVAKTFGVLMDGKAMAKRSTFVIDKQGAIAKVFPNVTKAGDHPQEVLDWVQKNLAKKK